MPATDHSKPVSQDPLEFLDLDPETGRVCHKVSCRFDMRAYYPSDNPPKDDLGKASGLDDSAYRSIRPGALGAGQRDRGLS